MPGTNTQAFGTGPRDEGTVITPQDLALQENPNLQMAKDIHAIEERFCLPGGLQPAQINLTQNQMLKIDCSQWSVNSLLLTVNSGIVMYWFGDFTSANGVAQTFSHGIVSAGVLPQSQQVVLPPGNYIFTFQANGGAATGYVTPMAI